MIVCLVDTDVLIDASRGVDKAIDFLKEHESLGDVGISVITQMELVVGCRDKSDLRQVNRFLQRFVNNSDK
jgi:predicted nucleic acid-binding protein